MPEANLFLMFTQRLNTLGVAYMVSGSVAVIIYGEPRLTKSRLGRPRACNQVIHLFGVNHSLFDTFPARTNLEIGKFFLLAVQ